MFAVLKDNHDIPYVLFEITRETPKRYYGKTVDSLDGTRLLYLRGLVRNRNQEEWCDKDIVIGLVRSANAWLEIKNKLIEIRQMLKRRCSVCEEVANQARAKCRREQAEAIVLAQTGAGAYLANVLV